MRDVALVIATGALMVLFAVAIRLLYLKITNKDTAKTKDLLNKVAIAFAIPFAIGLVSTILNPPAKSTDSTNAAQDNSGKPAENQTEEKASDTSFIFNADEYAKISVDDLKAKMGEPADIKDEENNKTNNTSSVQIYSYDKDSLHYEFSVADNVVENVSIYSDRYWNKKGDYFKYEQDNRQDILEAFNIKPYSDASVYQNDTEALKISGISNKISSFEVYDTNGKNKTYGMVKIVYNPKYTAPVPLTDSQVLVSSLIVVVILGLGAFIIIKMIRRTRRINEAHNQMVQRLREQGMNQLEYFLLVSGLPLPTNTSCMVTSWQDRIEIEANNTKFTLPKNKIIDASLKTEVGISSHYETRNGEIIEKERKMRTTYLIFTYSKGESVNYIKFNVTNSIKQANSFINEIKSGLTNKKNVHL